MRGQLHSQAATLNVPVVGITGTGGAGKSFPGLMADMFQRRTSIVRLDAKSLRKSAPAIARFSAIEGLDAHGRSASIRLE